MSEVSRGLRSEVTSALPLTCVSGPWRASLSSLLPGHAHLTDFNIATIIKDGERATALAGTKPYMGEHSPAHTRQPTVSQWPVASGLVTSYRCTAVGVKDSRVLSVRVTK